MPIDFTVNDDKGQAFDGDPETVIDGLRADGFQPVGFSPDGLSVTLQDDQGSYQVDLADLLKEKGYTLADAKPRDVDYSAVDPATRASLSALPDDGMRKYYLERKLKDQGIEQPRVVGSGRDWYTFNPTTNQWLGVSNSPDWDSSDLAEAATAAPRVIGSIAGGTLGAGGGIPGSMVGTGLGGAGGQAITQSIAAALDPDYAAAVEENPGAFDKDVALTGGTDALFGALPPMLKKSVLGRFASAPLSSTVKGVGATVEPAGKVLSQAAGLADMGPLTRGIGTTLTPGLGTAQAYGFAAGLPSKVSKWAAEKFGGQGAVNSAEEALAGFGSKAGDAWKGAGQQTGKFFDELGNLGGKLETGAEELYGAGIKGIKKVGDVVGQAGQGMRRAGDALKPYEPYLLGEPGAEELKARLFQREKNLGQPLPNRKAGSSI